MSILRQRRYFSAVFFKYNRTGVYYTMKKIILTLCAGFFISVSLICSMQRTEAALTGGVLRLHVRANSDSAEDQALKLKVRDRIISDSRELFADETSISNARTLVSENLEKIKASAQDEVEKNGFDYPVSISFGKSDFPEKIYNNITMPAGTYEALIVDIGSGKGRNWWCVLFPPLCFVNETCTEISGKSEDILIDNLGKDAYELIKEGKEPSVKIRFKLYELWEDGKNKIRTVTAKGKK